MENVSFRIKLNLDKFPSIAFRQSSITASSCHSSDRVETSSVPLYHWIPLFYSLTHTCGWRRMWMTPECIMNEWDALLLRSTAFFFFFNHTFNAQRLVSTEGLPTSLVHVELSPGVIKVKVKWWLPFTLCVKITFSQTKGSPWTRRFAVFMNLGWWHHVDFAFSWRLTRVWEL